MQKKNEAAWENEFEHFDDLQHRELHSAWRELEGEQWSNEFERMKEQLSDKIAYSRYLDTLSDDQAQVIIYAYQSQLEELEKRQT